MVAGSLHTQAYAEFLKAFRAVYPNQQLEEWFLSPLLAWPRLRP